MPKSFILINSKIWKKLNERLFLPMATLRDNKLVINNVQELKIYTCIFFFSLILCVLHNEEGIIDDLSPIILLYMENILFWYGIYVNFR